MILSGAFRSGQRLVQQELAARFGVAQSVVRESLLELQFCGLVKAVDHSGMFVSELDPKELLQAYQIREMFEGLAARLCCENACRADLRELANWAESSYEAARQEESQQRAEFDRLFHFRMVEMSGNALAARLIEAHQVLGMFVRADRDHDEVHQEHLDMVRLIETNEPEKAEDLARHHVREGWRTVKQRIDEGTFVPHWIGESKESGETKKPS
jgi:DNA-binding GntR family transcriptional regulator